jgi:dTDP-4-amino-4,6-dideoxygalactose transaminase
MAGHTVIPCANPKAQYLTYKADIDAAMLKVTDSGWYILGEEVRAFEAEFAAYIGVEHGVGVGAGSGAEALHLALAACGVGPGDEVITVSHTAVATVAAIELLGATPVLVDIERDSFTLDPKKLERAITPRTKAIIPVHLYGQAADLDPILALARPRGIRVIEDCTQSHGATYHGKRMGSIGDIACFSFSPQEPRRHRRRRHGRHQRHWSDGARPSLPRVRLGRALRQPPDWLELAPERPPRRLGGPVQRCPGRY